MKRWLPALLILLAPVSPVRADGDGPSRKMTATEAAAFNALKSAFQEALPRTPANYSLVVRFGSDPGEITLPEAIKPDQMARMSFIATYTLSQEVRDAQQRGLFMDRARGTPEQQAKIAALDARDAELKRARDATRDRGEKDRIRAESKAVQAEANALREQVMADYQAWVAAGGANAALQTADQALPAKELTVRAFINQDVSVNDKAAPYKLAGFPLAFEQGEGCQDFDTSCITVFLGAFDKEKRVSGYTRYNLKNANLGVPTKPRGLVLVIAGPKASPQSARDFLGKVNLGKLKALVP